MVTVPAVVDACSTNSLGLTILVAHHPPRLSLHSIQDGHELQSIPLEPESALTGVWWLKHTPKPVPEVWKREEIIVRQALCAEICSPDAARLRALYIAKLAPARPFQRLLPTVSGGLTLSGSDRTQVDRGIRIRRPSVPQPHTGAPTCDRVLASAVPQPRAVVHSPVRIRAARRAGR